MWSFNIKWSFLLIIAYSFTELTSQKQSMSNVRERIAVLRQQLVDEIQQKRGKIQPIQEDTSFEDNEYDTDRLLMSPIVKKKKKKPIVVTTQTIKTSTVNSPAILPTKEYSTPSSQSRAKKVKIFGSRLKNIPKQFNVMALRQPYEIFYRRVLKEYDTSKEIQWVHCQDLITPFLLGVKKKLSPESHLTPHSPVVKRFFHLLTLNTTMYTKEDIYSVLYQMSNLQLRLFHWNVDAINMLFSIIMDDKKHTFGNLKEGIRSYFDSWRLDISNLTNLLQQTRLFRPPCIKISGSTGSTKSNKVSSYPKEVTHTNYCDSSEGVNCKLKIKNLKGN